MFPRWLLAILVAAAVSALVFSLTGSSEVTYIARSIARHVSGSGW